MAFATTIAKNSCNKVGKEPDVTRGVSKVATVESNSSS